MSKAIDLAGQTFGLLTVECRSGSKGNRLAKWVCQCACGTRKVICGQHLRTGVTTSCGCKRSAPQRRTASPRRSVIAPGDTFGLWSVLSSHHKDAAGHIYWLCQCSCGNRQHIEASALTRGRSKSCGCTIDWWPKVIAGKEWNAQHAR